MSTAIPVYPSVLVFGDHADRVIETVGFTADRKAFELGYYNGDGKGKAIINISPAVGCAVGCSHCDLTEAGRNLNISEMTDQVTVMLRLAKAFDDYDPAQPVKVNIAKTGEPVFHKHMPDAMHEMTRMVPGISFKYSTSMPDARFLVARISELAAFARDYTGGSTQLQISLISTNEAFRQSFARAGLAPLPRVREAVEAWRAINPQGRVPNCSLLVGDGTPCDPDEIADILPPGLVKFRIRAIVPNENTALHQIGQAKRDDLDDIVRRFRDNGHDISTAGLPTRTEMVHGLASNVTRLRMMRGQFQDGVWDIPDDFSATPPRLLMPPEGLQQLLLRQDPFPD